MEEINLMSLSCKDSTFAAQYAQTRINQTRIRYARLRFYFWHSE
jgi:hypothetical protein